MATALPDRELGRCLDAALDDLLRFDPVLSSTVGHPAHDGAYADLSEPGRRARRQALRGHVHLLEGRRGADPDIELDRRLLLDELQVLLRAEEDLDPVRRNPALAVQEVLGGIHLLLTRPPLQPHLGALLGRLRQVGHVLTQAQAELDPADVPRLFCETAIASARAGLALLSEGVPAAVQAAVGETPLSASVSAAAGEAALRLGEYANFVEERVLPAAAGDFAAGDSYFTFLLHKKHGILRAPADLLRLGEAEIERLSGELREVARRLRPRVRTWQECFALLEAEGVLPPGEAALSACQALAEQARAACVAASLCPLPDGEELLVQPTPAFARPVVPFAGYRPPAPLSPAAEGEDELRGVLWLTAEARHSRQDLLLTCLHEGYPGRHVQACHVARIGSRVRKVVGTPAARDGWALYAESLLPELDLAGSGPSAVLDLYRLRGLLWRAHRVVLDVGVHCLGLSFEEAVSRLMAGIGFHRAQAEAEVRRCAATPTQPLCYLLGYLAIQKLRAEAERRQGAAFRLGAFHGEVLRHGAIPLGYLHERIQYPQP